MKTLLLGVWYRDAEAFGAEYFRSLHMQSDRDFDTLIITDHYALPSTHGLTRLNVLEAGDDASPATIREQGIRYAVAHAYDALIFTDCDDYYSADRVCKAKAGLESSDVCVNNLALVDEAGQLITSVLYEEFSGTPSLSELMKYNRCGLSNTAMRIDAIPDDFYIPPDIVAADWWIVSLLRLHQKTFAFDSDVQTYYRQHCMNTVGMGNLLTERRLFSGIAVKQGHYRNLLRYLHGKHFLEEELMIRRHLYEMIELADHIRDEAHRRQYMRIINNNYARIARGWWSEILPLEEWKSYV